MKNSRFYPAVFYAVRKFAGMPGATCSAGQNKSKKVWVQVLY